MCIRDRTLAHMARAVEHRGLHGSGQFSEGPVGLVHRDSDPQASTPQPIVEDDVVVMVDGWIANPADVARRAGIARPMR